MAQAMISVATPGRRSVSQWWGLIAPYVFISPFFILFGIFGAFPIVYALWVSVHKWQGLGVGEFVGLGNYALLFTDPEFATSLVNTIIIGIIYVPSMVLVSLVLASVLNRPFRFRGVYRTIVFLPVVTSMVVVGILFSFFFGSHYTPLTPVLGLFGIPAQSWLGEAPFIKPIIVLMLLWRWIGYNMMIMLAGLQTIPYDLYEAAHIDGANGFQAFTLITIPSMTRIIAFVSILSTIGMFNIFDEVYLLVGAGGGVSNAGLVTGLLIYQDGFQNFNFGYASAIAYAVGAIIIALSMLQVFASERSAGTGEGI